MLLMISKIVGFALITLFGLFSHFAKRKIRGQSLESIHRYFKTHLKYTILAVGSAMVGFAIVWSLGNMSIYEAFAVGYMSDSLFNRAEKEKYK